MSVRLQKPESANYSVKFLSCRRPPSPYPGRQRCRKCTATGFFNLFKHFLKHECHIHTNKGSKTASIPHVSSEKEAIDDAMVEEATALGRRNAFDYGPSTFPHSSSSLTLCERGKKGVRQADQKEVYQADKKDVCQVNNAEESRREGDGEDPFGGGRGWGMVLAWMHEHGTNAAGFPTTERERQECGAGRCRCLGPLARDV